MTKKLSIDYISDVHLGFYLPYNDHLEFKKEDVKILIENNIASKKVGDILVIAGDICESMECTAMFLEECSKYYDKVFTVMGNHEYYMSEKLMLMRYEYNSLNKIQHLIELTKNNNKIVILDRNNEKNKGLYKYDGFTIAGDTLWYLPIGVHGWSFYHMNSNDSRLIYTDINMSEDRIMKLHLESLDWYDSIPECDLIITHVPPIHNPHSPYDANSCYYCNVSELKSKLWIYGHDHVGADFNSFGTRFLSNPMGYYQKVFKIKNIEVTK